MRFPTTTSTLSLLILLQLHAAEAAFSISFLSSLPSLATDNGIPNQNLLTYLSTTHDTSPLNSSALCTTILSRDKTALLLPNARIPLSSAGFIGCFLEKPQGPQAEEDNQHQQLVFTGIPAGWQFSIAEITIGGWLDLERGSFVERVSLSLMYPVPCTEKIAGGGGDTSSSMGQVMLNSEEEEEVEKEEVEKEEVEKVDKGWRWKWDLIKRREPGKPSKATQATKGSQDLQSQSQALVDTATAIAPYGRFGTGYRGAFNLSMPVKPSSGASKKGKRKQRLAVSSCSTGAEMEVRLGAELWFSLSSEQIEFDDTVAHRGMLGGELGEPGELPGEGDGRHQGWEACEKTLRVGMRGEWKRC
ncbi:uncharacterized protein B0T23DRAFT_318711 [Neurospora hispaniola]|uniref:Uncharacterized protein n=1 Tax=Neurospora hispaniola TaxID=588809 RepID=A0AAJ0I6H4_9PEZI|nr:hypothetical protein B0T23DRAFT_318711 [Neurospora hispaniola]